MTKRTEFELTETLRAAGATFDEMAGIAWWNDLTESQRLDALIAADPKGLGFDISGAQAWAFHKATPPHRRGRQRFERTLRRLGHLEARAADLLRSVGASAASADGADDA